MDNLILTIPEKFGILPGKLYLRKPKVYKLLSSVHVIINFSIFISPAIYLGVKSMEEDSMANYWVMSSVTILLVTFLTVIPVLYNCVLYPADYVEMQNHFRKIKTIFEKRSIIVRTDWMVLKFILFHLIYVICNILSISIFWGHMHKALTILMLWPTYIWYLEVAIAWQILEAVRSSLKHLNQLINGMYRVNFLLEESAHKIKSVVPWHWNVKTSEDDEEVLDLIEIFERITKIVNIFNKLFGIFNAMLVFAFLIEFVAVIYRIIAWTDDMESVYMDLISAILHTVQWLIFVVKAQHVIDEGNNSVEICLETTFRSLREKKVPLKWKEDMAHLSLYVITNSPHFTAAKFFVIDYSSIFTMFNMMTGYIIVAVQFANAFRENEKEIKTETTQPLPNLLFD